MLYLVDATRLKLNHLRNSKQSIRKTVVSTGILEKGVFRFEDENNLPAMPEYDLNKPGVHMLINEDLKTQNVKLNLILQYAIPN